MQIDRERLAHVLAKALTGGGLSGPKSIDHTAIAKVLSDIEAQGFVIIQRVEPSRIEELETDIIRLRNALLEIMDLPGELNMSNYTHDDVAFLNDSHVEAYMIALEAIGGGDD